MNVKEFLPSCPICGGVIRELIAKQFRRGYVAYLTGRTVECVQCLTRWRVSSAYTGGTFYGMPQCTRCGGVIRELIPKKMWLPDKSAYQRTIECTKCLAQWVKTSEFDKQENPIWFDVLV